MADRWTLVTPQGDYQLNASFSAPNLHAGGVDTNAALRRDGLRSYQRSGDGLRTPGPLILKGRVWRDDHLIAAMVDELNDIRDAVAATIAVKRENNAGTYTYSELAGGPPPAITPDGLGGWQVEIELWPGRPSATYVPFAVDTYLYVYVDGSQGMDADRPAILDAMQNLKGILEDEIYGDLVNERVTITTTADDAQNERWLFHPSQPTEEKVVVIAVYNEAEPLYHVVPRAPSGEPTASFLTDHASWKQQFETKARRQLLLYAIHNQVDEWYYSFHDHVVDAMDGTGGYPTALSTLGVQAKLEVPTGLTAQDYYDDIFALLVG